MIVVTDLGGSASEQTLITMNVLKHKTLLGQIARMLLDHVGHVTPSYKLHRSLPQILKTSIPTNTCRFPGIITASFISRLHRRPWKDKEVAAAHIQMAFRQRVPLLQYGFLYQPLTAERTPSCL